MDESLRKLAEEAPVPIWVSGPNRGCVYVNRRWLEFTGRRLEQELGKGWLEGVHRDDLDRCLAAYSWAFEARQVLRVDYRLKRRDGADRRGTAWGVARTGAQGRFEGYVAFWLDGTERAQAEQVLEKSKALRFAAFESLPGKVVVIAKDARVLAAKESRVPGDRPNAVDPDALSPGANYRRVCAQAAAQGDRHAHAVLLGLEAVLAGKRERFVLKYPCHAPGSERWFELLVYPVKSPLAGAILLRLEVTARHLAETFVRCLARGDINEGERALKSLIREVKRVDEASTNVVELD